MHNDSQNNANLPLPFPDALQVVRVATTGLTAQNGMHSGASVNAITKSERIASPAISSSSTATTASTRSIVREGRQRQAGGRRPVEEPVGRHRRRSDRARQAFFFGAYQGTNQHQIPASKIAFVPTDAMLRGDFTTFASAACNGGTPVTLRAP
jgi:hypothetical protein